MPCMHPYLARLNPKGAGRPVPAEELGEFRRCWKFGLRDRADEILADVSILRLPCGSCVGCALSRARDWAIRCSLELMQHRPSSCYFITLTYSEKYVPPTLSKLDLSRYFRYLRRAVAPHPVRFFACGEYGEWFSRPHYHAVVFGAPDADDLRQAWTKGFVMVSPVNPARISYVAGYCAKKIGQQKVTGEFVDPETGEVFEHQPPFLQMSRRPGIAGDVRQHRRSWRTHAVWNGVQVPVPRFLHASWKDGASELELAALALEKLESRMVLTTRELEASEAIAQSRIALKSSGRVL